jgi:hypothetical protein
LKKQKEALDWLDKNVFNEPVWMREFDYCNTMNRDTRQLTLPLARSVAAQVVARLNYLNVLYPADRFVADIVRLCFAEAQSGKSVNLYRQTLQTALVNNLIQQFKTASTSSASRTVILMALQSIQSKVKSASGDALSKAHFQNLNDLIARALVVK